MGTQNTKATGIASQVANAEKPTYKTKKTKKVKKLVKEYNESEYYSPFNFAINKVMGESTKWDEIPKEQQSVIIRISKALEEYA